MMKGKGWRDEPQPGHTGLGASHVAGMAFILTALREALRRLTFGGVPHIWPKNSKEAVEIGRLSEARGKG